MRLVNLFPEFMLGAGTVTTFEEVEAAKEAGAQFAVAPGCNPKIVKRARELDLPFFPGVCTASDIESALDCGCETLKFFPAEAAGGTKMIKALYAPYKHRGIRFIPTGGVTADNLTDYLSQPGVLAIGGSWIVAKDLLGAKNWDKVVLGVFAVMYLAEIVVGALDYRWGWSAMSLWFWPVGVVLYAFFLVVVTWAMSVNTHFEKTVRIQSDRNHRVIDSGPYGIVRHPGYLATIAGFIVGVPLLLGSWWAFLPAFAAGACLVVRTFLEDRMLRRELTGYEAYAQRVRYRLIRGLW